jgi:hypothetical protein
VGLSTRGYAECVFLTFWDLAVAGGFLTAALAAWASLRSRSRQMLPELAVVQCNPFMPAPSKLLQPLPRVLLHSSSPGRPKSSQTRTGPVFMTADAWGSRRRSSRGEPGQVHALDHCRLKDGERCSYFERCVFPGITRQDRAKIGEFALENKGVAGGISAGPSPSIKKLSQSQIYKKRKKLRAQVKTRLKARRAS